MSSRPKPSRSISLLALPLLLIAAATSPTPSAAAVQSRIQSIGTGTGVALPNSIPRRATLGTDLGAAPASLKLSSMTMYFNMTAAQQAALTQLLIDQQNPSSPRYHQWLTPEQFGAQFGLSSQDIAAVTNWLTSKGFAVTDVARSSNSVSFSGTAAQIQQAFGTTIHQLTVDGEQHFSNLTDPVLPASISAVVSTISGLNDFKLRARARTHVAVPTQTSDASGVHPSFTSATSGNNYVAPGDFYAIYDENPLLTSSTNGSGVTIAVMGQTDISLADIAAFRSAAGLSANVPTVKLYGTDPGTSTDDLPEASLDVEWSGSTAPSASILYVNSTDVINGSLKNAIQNKLAPIITISYGDCEPNYGVSSLASYNVLFQQANAQGQTIVGPAGDSGATDCDYQNYPATGGLAVDFPASSPYVTAAGGSMFNEQAGNYWKTASGSDVITSALGYIPEAVWNETSSSNGLGAGGGGASAFFTKPYWQIDTVGSPSSVPADSSRDVPDIALNAAANHDGYLFCSGGFCTNGFRNSTGNLDVVGGTSVATPSFAGLLALVLQKTGATGGLGNVNPTIYALANSSYYGSVFHDIQVGNNDSPCTAGTPNCPNGGSIGYNATSRYDLATGWGSVDATNMVNTWSLVTPIPAVVGAGTTVTAVSLTNASTSPVCGVSGSSITLNVTVAGANSSTAPTGTVTFLVDNVAVSGSNVTLAAGTATYTLSTKPYSSGAHVITAVYSGDGTFAASKNTLTADVVSATTADFAFTPCTPTVTAKTGTTATAIPFTLASVNGFAGSITFSATSNDSSLAANYSFSVTPVVLTSGSSQTTNFVLTAFQTNSSSSTSTGLLKLGANHKPANPARAPWYAAGSGATLAGLLLLVLPRRRRWAGLLVAVLTVGLLAASGCSSSSTTGGSGGTTPTQTNAAPGTYDILVTAFATTSTGTLVHSTNVTFTVTP